MKKIKQLMVKKLINENKHLNFEKILYHPYKSHEIDLKMIHNIYSNVGVTM